MPIYDYRCEACGHEQEFLQKMSEDPKTICPKCNEPKLVKKVTAAGFQLKGSGWYVTDFRSNGGKPAPNTAASASDDAKSGSKSDTKPAESSVNTAAPAATPAPAPSPTPAPASSPPPSAS